MKFYFKISVWEEITISHELEKEVKKLIKKGKIKSSNGLINHVESKNGNWDLSQLHDTEETLKPNQTIKGATIEVEQGEEKIYSNI